MEIQQHVALLPLSALASTAPSQFLRLPHPRSRLPCLFLPYPLPPSPSTEAPHDPRPAKKQKRTCGLLEVQGIHPDVDAQRSWFHGEQVISDGRLTIMTPFDPIFLIISLFASISYSESSIYQSHSDIFDAISELPFLISPATTSSEEELTDYTIGEDARRFGALDCVSERMNDICDQQEYEGIKLYRLSQLLIIEALKSKIDRLTNTTLGIFGAYASTELGVSRPIASLIVENELEGDITGEASKPFPTVSRGLTKGSVGDGRGISEANQLAIRQRSAITIISNYLPDATTKALAESYSFTTLEEASAETTRESIILSSTYLPGRNSSSALGDPIGGSGNGFGAAAKEKAKKAAAGKGGRGVELLKKVNTSGMQKLTGFFTKKA